MADVLENPTTASPPLLSDDERWNAVMARDVRLDGHFYYAVTTTGVYCRPSCPARRPRRNHVCFHDSAAAAEAAGFRPCMRCKPGEVSPSEQRAAQIAQACRIIEAAEEPPPLAALADAVGLSPYHFHRAFKAALGITPKAYASAQRSARVRAAISSGATMTKAIYGAGFNSTGRFYAGASEALGMPPRTFRTGGAGEEICYAVAPCAFGQVLVAESSKGVCAIMLGDAPEALIAELHQQFPKAQIVAGNDEFTATTGAVLAFIDAPDTPLDLPLDIRGTAFQRRVWEALRQIPVGKTATYSEVAATLAAPKAARAVASACAANRLAVAIPCHRVVRGDGSLSGYRWGPDRKAALLAKEKRS